MQSIEIIAINDNDFDILLSLWESYQRFYEVDIPEAMTLNTWTRFSEPVEPMFTALAVVDGQASGLVHSIWTCPYKTGHQLPVKLMLLPSA